MLRSGFGGVSNCPCSDQALMLNCGVNLRSGGMFDDHYEYRGAMKEKSIINSSDGNWNISTFDDLNLVKRTDSNSYYSNRISNSSKSSSNSSISSEDASSLNKIGNSSSSTLLSPYRHIACISKYK